MKWKSTKGKVELRLKERTVKRIFAIQKEGESLQDAAARLAKDDSDVLAEILQALADAGINHRRADWADDKPSVEQPPFGFRNSQAPTRSGLCYFESTLTERHAVYIVANPKYLSVTQHRVADLISAA